MLYFIARRRVNTILFVQQFMRQNEGERSSPRISRVALSGGRRRANCERSRRHGRVRVRNPSVKVLDLHRHTAAPRSANLNDR